ncbi:hypothetical protein QYE76_063590 [Lolium multiflorum]|uniref:non-specific serine/threonine protein kinase n=1 Tax=Lolium multiflorum TaxID=4521 RepID=A0AAD8W8B5_LOLMU|nr:hypothetical protein QYE76_063590 [Lolium multiflorum]
MDSQSITTQSELKCMLCDEKAEPKALSLTLLEEITNGFSEDQTIGSGGFAVVYKGMLDNGAAVAVKRLSDSYMNYEEQFHREIECLIKAKHKNVVRFIGYCANSQGKAENYNGKFVIADVKQRLLCFEYLPQGTLDMYINDASCGLDWRTRYNIINGICDGLHYLHQNRIVHMDLKPPNILLEGNISPKIADFGLSRCFDEMQSRVTASKMFGTLGYLAPEFTRREITYRFDLYSLGVIIIEILTGKKGYESVEDVLESWRNRLEESHKDIQLEQIRVCTMIAMECMEFNPAKRPASTQHVIVRLHEIGNTEDSIETLVTRSSALQIESRKNGLEMQSLNNKGLVEELENLLERLQIPQEFAASLTRFSFEESRMLETGEACEWLSGAIRCLEVPNLDPSYVNMLAVRKKMAELEKLKITFVRRASAFLTNHFSSLVDSMIIDKSYFSQRGQLKRPDHADLRYKCRTYARLLQHLKSLDKSCLGPLRKAYCVSLNLLLRREAREFANELRASTKAPKNPAVWLEGSNSGGQNGSSADTSTVSDAYSKMLTIFIPLLVDESSFFAHFMCFEVPALVPAGAPNFNKYRSGANDPDDDDLSLMDPDGNDIKPDNASVELGTLDEALQELLDGIQEELCDVVDWAYTIDPLRCISMHGMTKHYSSGYIADVAGFVHKLLYYLESRISVQFSMFINEACHQVLRNERNLRQTGILAYIPRFSVLASQMEECIHGESRHLIDKAYIKLVSTMFTTLEKIAQSDPKTADIVLTENYAAFQNSLYDLANVVPTLAKFYHQASESYEQACTRHISSLIYLQFERLFEFLRKVDELTYTIAAEEIPFQLGLSKTDLRRVLKSSLSGIDKSIGAMYRRLQKTSTSDDLFPSLWDKCKKEFLDKYESFVQMVTRIYGNEPIMPVAEMRNVLAVRIC